MSSRWWRKSKHSKGIDDVTVSLERRALLPRLTMTFIGVLAGMRVTRVSARTTAALTDEDFDIDIRLSPNASYRGDRSRFAQWDREVKPGGRMDSPQIRRGQQGQQMAPMEIG